MEKLVFVLLLGALAFEVTSEKIRYSGYKVYRYVPQTDDEFKMLQELDSLGVQFWEGPSAVGKANDVMFAPHQLTFVEGLKNRGLCGVEYISNVQDLIDNEGEVDVGRSGHQRVISWTNYSSLEATTEWLFDQAQFHPSIASVVSIGKSYEGRDLNVIKISKSGETKKAIFIDSNIHAREWITSAVTTYVINELLNGQNNPLQAYLDDFDFYILPHLNPDGFAFTHFEDRLWRKTRSNTTSLIGCKGADPNRNFDYHWLDGGSSTNPCSDLFAGPSAFSEPETKALSVFLTSIKDRLVFYLSVHSYGHYILIPYGHSATPQIPEYNEYMRIGQLAADAIAQSFGTIFTPGNVVDLLYVASAESFDWVKGVLNPYLSLGIELRDQGHFGFVLPPEEIIPSAKEFVDGLVTFLEQVKIGTSTKQEEDIPSFQYETFGHVSQQGSPVLDSLRRS